MLDDRSREKHLALTEPGEPFVLSLAPDIHQVRVDRDEGPGVWRDLVDNPDGTWLGDRLRINVTIRWGYTVELINATRSEQGAAPLAGEPHADQVAQRWTEQMAASGDVAQSQLHAELADGISVLSSSSENVGFNSEGLVAVHQGLVNSPGHYPKIIGDHDAVGIGVTIDGRGVVWVTHNFVSLGL